MLVCILILSLAFTSCGPSYGTIHFVNSRSSNVYVTLSGSAVYGIRVPANDSADLDADPGVYNWTIEGRLIDWSIYVTAGNTVEITIP